MELVTIVNNRFLNRNVIKNKLRGLSPHANYTDRAASAGRRS